MISRRSLCLALLVLTCASLPLFPADLDLLARLRRTEQEDGRVMETAGLLCDGVGPRLTGSPQARAATELARQRLAVWGLSNVHLERWDFARGWSVERCSVHLVSPVAMPLIATPKAWSNGTRGTLRGQAIHVRVASEADLAQWHGRVAKKIVFLTGMTAPATAKPMPPHRWSSEELAALRTPGEPVKPPNAQEFAARSRLEARLVAFFAKEGALAMIESGGANGGTHLVVRPHGFIELQRSTSPPALMMAGEHFGRVVRLLDGGVPVHLELDVRTAFHEGDLTSANVIADLPGNDLPDEVVMLGAHLDSWHGGTGATDNAAGVAAAMEALRLLKLAGVRPRRTIRLALWTGEEQGLLGSRAYTAAHLGHRDEPRDELTRELPFFSRPLAGTLTTKPDLARFDAYFNLDYGTGKIRGIYVGSDTAAMPLVSAWLAPLAELGVSVVSPRSHVGSDHQAFESLGLPAFAFLQDDLDYLGRTHHTNMDVLERLEPDDLAQVSVVAAWVLYRAATSDERVPRPTLPNGKP
jgi:carboxypeptidase Q